MKEEKMPLIMKHIVWQWRYITDKTGFLFIGMHCICVFDDHSVCFDHLWFRVSSLWLLCGHILSIWVVSLLSSVLHCEQGRVLLALIVPEVQRPEMLEVQICTINTWPQINSSSWLLVLQEILHFCLGETLSFLIIPKREIWAWKEGAWKADCCTHKIHSTPQHSRLFAWYSKQIITAKSGDGTNYQFRDDWM